MNTALFKKEYEKARAFGWPAKEAKLHAEDKVRNSVLRHKYDVYPGAKQTLKIGDATFIISVEDDNEYGAPWDNQDMLGDIKPYHRWDYDYDKLPEGYVWLQQPDIRTDGHAYNKAAALANIRSWGKTYNKKLAENMVAAEIKYCQDWLTDQWYYVYVKVDRVCTCCNDGVIKSASVGGVESIDRAYLNQVIDDLLREHGVSYSGSEKQN